MLPRDSVLVACLIQLNFSLLWFEKMCRMEMIDLNELPEDNNPGLQIPGSNNIGDPAFYTQQSIHPGDAEHAEFVAESPNPMVTQNVGKPVPETMDTGGHSLFLTGRPTGY